MTAKEERNWRRIADLEAAVGKIKVEMLEMDRRLMLVEGHLAEAKREPVKIEKDATKDEGPQGFWSRFKK